MKTFFFFAQLFLHFAMEHKTAHNKEISAPNIIYSLHIAFTFFLPSPILNCVSLIQNKLCSYKVTVLQ